MGLPTVSPSDLTLSIAFPPNIRGRFTGDRLPRHSNNDSKLMYTIGTVLLKGLGIPAPRLLQALSQHDTPEDLSASLHRHWPSTAAPEQHPSPQRTAFLHRLDGAISADNDLAAALLNTPQEPGLFYHDQWDLLLSPATDALSSATGPTGTRHVLRLAFNSALVATAVREHLTRHIQLLRPAGTAHSRTELDHMEPWKRNYVSSAVRANAIPHSGHRRRVRHPL